MMVVTMRKQLLLSPAILLALASCGGSWTHEQEQAFAQSCMEAETTRGTSELTARAFCECALDKTSKRYATAAEATENRDSVAMARELEICRRSTR